MIQSIDMNGQDLNNLKYFSLCNLTNKIVLPSGSSPIGDVLSVFVSPKILSSRVVETMNGTSAEGYTSKGKGIIIDILFCEKLLYTQNTPNSEINVLNLEFMKSVNVSMPTHIEGTDIIKLTNINRLKPNVYIYGVSNYKLNESTVLNNIYSVIDIQYLPTYQLCYSTYDSLNISKLFMCYGNGSNSLLKAQINFCKIQQLKWSPDGNSIAYIKITSTGNALCLYNINRSFSNEISKEILIMKNLKGFTWSDNSTIIYCSKYEDEQNLYSINIKNLNINQLTFNPSNVYCENPKSIANEGKVVFIRKDSKNSCLYEMDSSGTNLKQISNIKDVINFTWSYDKGFIATIVSLTNFNDKSTLTGHFSTLIVFDLSTDTDINLTGPLEYKTILKVIPQPNASKFIFIANCGNKDDIFSFDYIQGRLINLTKNLDGVFISDVTCNFDGSLMYYSSNELGFYNIFSYEFRTLKKIHIVSTDALNIHLDYRPSL